MNPLLDNEETPIVPELLSKVAVTGVLGGVSTKHIDNLVRRGSMPEPIYLVRHPRWRRSELQQWMDEGCPVLDQKRYDAWMKEQREKNRERRSRAVGVRT